MIIQVLVFSKQPDFSITVAREDVHRLGVQGVFVKVTELFVNFWFKDMDEIICEVVNGCILFPQILKSDLHFPCSLHLELCVNLFDNFFFLLSIRFIKSVLASFVLKMSLKVY